MKARERECLACPEPPLGRRAVGFLCADCYAALAAWRHLCDLYGRTFNRRPDPDGHPERIERYAAIVAAGGRLFE